MPQTITDQLDQLARTWEDGARSIRPKGAYEYASYVEELNDTLADVYEECAEAVRKIVADRTGTETARKIEFLPGPATC